MKMNVAFVRMVTILRYITTNCQVGACINGDKNNSLGDFDFSKELYMMVVGYSTYSNVKNERDQQKWQLMSGPSKSIEDMVLEKS